MLYGMMGPIVLLKVSGWSMFEGVKIMEVNSHFIIIYNIIWKKGAKSAIDIRFFGDSN
jgi:hypothetical protein